MRHPLSIQELKDQTKLHINTAKNILLEQGSISPTGIVLDDEGTVTLIPFDFSDQEHKALSLAKFQVFIVKKKARAAWVFTETWTVVSSEEEYRKNPNITPSIHPEKIEGVIGIGSNEENIILSRFFYSRDQNNSPIPSDQTDIDVMGEGNMPEFTFETRFFPLRWETKTEIEEDNLDKLWRYFFLTN
jgi:hypothetical protein